MSWTFKYKVKIKAPLSDVFACFASLDGMKRWFVRDGVLEPRPGGRFHMIWDGSQQEEGKVVAFEKDKLFAFQWVGENLSVNTTATFIFETLEDGRTQVTCTDGEFPELIECAKSYSDVSEGWASCLMNLKAVMQYSVDLRD